MDHRDLEDHEPCHSALVIIKVYQGKLCKTDRKKVLQKMSITMYNTIQCSNRFRLLTKLCLPAEEHKNSFLGLTSSSQGEVTREMAVTSECKASKATTSVRLSEDQV